MSEPPALNPQDYELTEDQLQERFNAKIRPQLEGPSHERPTIVCVMGPMASGKTTTMSAAPRIFDILDATLIDGDNNVYAHPDYLSLREQYGERTARTMTQGPVLPLSDMSLDFVLENRRNAIIAGPMTDPDWFAQKFQPFADADFRIEAVPVTVHEARSLVGTVDRFYRAEEQRPGDGVFHDPAWHDRHYPGIRATVEAIERDGLADGLHIAQRGGRFIYSNQLLSRNPVTWNDPPQGVQALDEERARPWTDAEHAHHRDRTLTLITSPLIDDEKRLVVADAIARSHAPNDQAIQQLTTEAEELAEAASRDAGPAMSALSADASEQERQQAREDDRSAVAELTQRAELRAQYSTDLREAAHTWADSASPWQERPYGQVPDEQLAELFTETERRHQTISTEAGARRGRGDADAWRYEVEAGELSAAARSIHGEQVIRASLAPVRAEAEAAERRDRLAERGQPAAVDPEAAEAIALLREQLPPSSRPGSSPRSGPIGPGTTGRQPPARPHMSSPEQER